MEPGNRPAVDQAEAAMRRQPIQRGILAAAGGLGAQGHVATGLDALAGHWRILDARGTPIGESRVDVQEPGAMLFEIRRIGAGKPQTLWFANLEDGGWTQLFVNPRGTLREFRTLSAAGAWPIVMGADVTTQDGQRTRFRMTLSRASDDESRRLLESSRDAGVTWTTVFDYTYRRTKEP